MFGPGVCAWFSSILYMRYTWMPSSSQLPDFSLPSSKRQDYSEQQTTARSSLRSILGTPHSAISALRIVGTDLDLESEAKIEYHRAQPLTNPAVGRYRLCKLSTCESCTVLISHTHTLAHINTTTNSSRFYTPMSEPETLETFISAKFTALALSVPEDDVSQDSLPHHSSSCELSTQDNV